MTRFPDLFTALAAPFESHEVRSRSQAGRQVHYITARTAMNRLDSTLGPENWWDEYVPGENSVLCRLTVRLPDGSTLTKADAGGYAGMQDQGDDDKSGFSDAFKRAAVKFGVGRYLYRDGVPTFSSSSAPAPESPDKPSEPQIPVEMVPATSAATNGTNGHYEKRRGVWGNPKPQAPAPTPTQSSPSSVSNNPKVPATGRALFAWCKDQEQRHEVGLVKYLNNWAKLQEFPGRMVDWDGHQVEQAYTEAVRKLQSIHPSEGELYERNP